MYWTSKYTTAAYAMLLILMLFPNVVDEVPRLGSWPINTEDIHRILEQAAAVNPRKGSL